MSEQPQPPANGADRPRPPANGAERPGVRAAVAETVFGIVAYLAVAAAFSYLVLHRDAVGRAWARMRAEHMSPEAWRVERAVLEFRRQLHDWDRGGA